MKTNVVRMTAAVGLLLASTLFQSSVTRSASTSQSAAPTFLETFDGQPLAPQPWRPDNWDVVVHSRDVATWDHLEPMHAEHGADCSAPPATHDIQSYDDAVFSCKDHLMTAIKAGGYGVIYLTPNNMVDFAREEGVIRFDVSTARTTSRDWIDVWITPFQDNLELPLQDWMPDLDGEPRNAVHIVMDLSMTNTGFQANVIRDFQAQQVVGGTPWVGYETVLTPSARTRTTFEIRISRDHLKVGLPAYNLWWVDGNPKLNWTRGVVQFGHHSYNPLKNCSTCAPNTWHWDNISITPAVPFDMVRAQQRTASAAAHEVTLARPSPQNGMLRFAGIGGNIQISTDGGATWQTASMQAQEKFAQDHFRSYWTPLPAGTTSVQFRGDSWWGGGWLVRDISVWSSCAPLSTSGAGEVGPAPAGPNNLYIPLIRDC